MPTAKFSSDTEKFLCRYCWVINRLKDYGILTTTLVQASTTVSDLIARLYAALLTGTTSLYAQEGKILVRILEQGLRLAETLGLLNTTLVGLLSTVNTVNSGTTDLRWLLAEVISDTSNLDYTLSSDPGADLGMANAVTS